MTSMFSQTGGATIGLFNASWPLAKLSATSDMIRLSCVGRECLFLKGNVRSLIRHRGLFSHGLLIEHTVSAYPERVVFWTFGFETLKRGLESVGYEVREAPGVRGDSFVVAGLSFIPVLGVVFGVAAIVWGLSPRTKGGRVRAAVGAAGIAFNVLLMMMT